MNGTLDTRAAEVLMELTFVIILMFVWFQKVSAVVILNVNIHLLSWTGFALGGEYPFCLTLCAWQEIEQPLVDHVFWGWREVGLTKHNKQGKMITPGVPWLLFCEKIWSWCTWHSPLHSCLISAILFHASYILYSVTKVYVILVYLDSVSLHGSLCFKL